MGFRDQAGRAILDRKSGRLRIHWILLVVFVQLQIEDSDELFSPGKEYVFEYEATSSSGVLLPSKAQSAWGFSGSLVVQADKDAVLMQFQSLKTKVSNGKDELDMASETVPIDDSAKDLMKPFRVQYKDGLVGNFSVEPGEDAWATNIKRSVAGILQLDVAKLNSQAAFQSVEVNHYGQCTMDYVVTSNPNEKRMVRKSVDPRKCRGHSHRSWTNVPRMPCPHNDQDPIMKSSERFYEISVKDNKTEIFSINATGEIYVQPFQSLGEAHFLLTSQRFKLISETEKEVNSTSWNRFVVETIQHKLPENDLTQGRGTPDKDFIFKSISTLLDRLSQRLENPGLDTEVNNLHNTTISVLLYYLGMLNRVDLQAAYNNISGTSYIEETVRNMFLEALPQVGTTESTLFILELIQSHSVSDITAIQLLTHLPFHVRKPDVQLLLGLQPLLNLHTKLSPEVQHTGILTFGTLVHKTCLLVCPYEMLDDYVKLFLDKFTESKEYEKKMVWLEGLSNIQLGRVVEFLEPIASGNSAESRHLRALAAWASLPTASLRPDVIYPVYWPILVNRSEHLEMRVASLNLLIVSSPTPSRLISLYWYLKEEPNQHLYNFFYTTLKSMERSKYPCYTQIGGVAAQFIRILKKPSQNRPILTGNYLVDYKDSRRHFGAVIHGIVISSSITNMPEVAHITLNNHGSGLELNHVSVSIKAEGFLHAIATNLNDIGLSPRVDDILKLFKFEKISPVPVHFEVIIRVQQKAVLCLHLNNTNLIKAFKYLSTIQESTYHVFRSMEFHVNQQRMHVPMMMESIQMTDIGSNVRISAAVTSLFSMRGNFTHTVNGRNNHFILRTSIHGTESIENYNPLSDIWHAAIRAQSMHLYVPTNITFGFEEKLFFSFNTATEKLRAGIIAHVRTITNLRGSNVRSKLKSVCPNCASQYTVKRVPSEEAETKDLLTLEAPELGGLFGIKIFDCERQIPTEEYIITDILASHQSNCQVWPLLETVLLGVHFLDYLTYVPPSGSCGVEAYVEPISTLSSEIRFEYAKKDQYHMFSLTRRDLNDAKVLDQWSIAVAYDIPSWISDSLKIKASRSLKDGKVMKVCFEGERDTPWDWDFLSTKPSDPSKIKLNIAWGMADSAKGKCSGSSLLVNLVGEVTDEQVSESKRDVWPYDVCQSQAKGKSFIPYTEACYEASREMSTLRKYKIEIIHENIPSQMSRMGNRLGSLYNFIGGSSGNSSNSNQVSIIATFPKESSSGELVVNGEKIQTYFNTNLVNSFLVRSRLHKYLDSIFLKSFFSTCILTPESIRSSNNISFPFQENTEKLILAKCDDSNPKFALTATSKGQFVEVVFNDETDRIILSSDGEGGVVHNHTNVVPLSKNFEFYYIGSKWARMDKKTIDLVVAEVSLFVHWSQDQVIFIYPNLIQEFVCGYCTSQQININGMYEKL